MKSQISAIAAAIFSLSLTGNAFAAATFTIPSVPTDAFTVERDFEDTSK